MSDVLPPRPTSYDPDAWNAYWTTQGEPWRTEPEISQERQHLLARRRENNEPHFAYPFLDARLDRADIEWLLHEHVPIDWSDPSQRAWEGLDLRGALLQKNARHVAANLEHLPLAKVRFGRTTDNHVPEGQEDAAAYLQGVLLVGTHLEGASLCGTHLEGAFLRGAYLEGADLRDAHLEGADLQDAHLEGANLQGAHLEGANLQGAHLEETTS